MKRKGFIYEKIVELDNIELAICKASTGKTKRKNVEKILDSPTYYAMQVQKMLKEKIPIEKIMKFTELTKEEIEKLK